jgi:type VI secretion system protein ImpM
MTLRHHAHATSWYGKVPSRGDFVSAGLTLEQVLIWDGWLQQGLAKAAQSLGAAELGRRLRAFGAWRFLAWPEPQGLDGAALAGVLVPSHDRVGRAFPLMLVQAFEPAALAWRDIEAGLARLADAALDTTDQPGMQDFEMQLRGLASVFAAQPHSAAPPGAEKSPLVLLRNSPGHRSLWWSEPPPGAAPMPLGENWPPHEELLLDILATATPGG